MDELPFILIRAATIWAVIIGGLNIVQMLALAKRAKRLSYLNLYSLHSSPRKLKRPIVERIDTLFDRWSASTIMFGSFLISLLISTIYTLFK